MVILVVVLQVHYLGRSLCEVSFSCLILNDVGRGGKEGREGAREGREGAREGREGAREGREGEGGRE